MAPSLAIEDVVKFSGVCLIYYPEGGSGVLAEDVTCVVGEWRTAQGLPGFKEG
ncbi:bacteriocin immunity protein [Pseudomonas sp. N3-W]|uniref:bacteriocin immunity protein n=1 Tax=Pseudomonas sp. N3-W TaxID=2975049 RepID=UPI00287792B4|nr:bacteriocin immunity protein [Pseudomonas sp. N3-W]